MSTHVDRSNPYALRAFTDAPDTPGGHSMSLIKSRERRHLRRALMILLATCLAVIGLVVQAPAAAA